MESEEIFYNHKDEFFRLQDSAWDKFPTVDNPYDRYKYISMDIELIKSLKQFNRQTYGLLEWLGDCGGLLDALLFLSKIIIKPFAVFSLWQKLTEILVRILPT